MAFGRFCSRSPLIRVLVTLAVVLAYFMGNALPFPGGARAVPEQVGLLQRALDFPHLSVGFLGMQPIVSGFLVVEFAALLVPPWRRLRNGSERGRTKLFIAALVVTAVVVAFQAELISSRLAGFEGIHPGNLAGAYLAWTAVLLGFAYCAERCGALGGIQNLVLGEVVFSFAEDVALLRQAAVGQPTLLFLLGMLLLALPVLTRGSWPAGERSSDSVAPRALFPWFVAGIIPVNFAVGALGLPEPIARLVGEQSPVYAVMTLLDAYPYWTIVVLASALFALAPAFYRLRSLRMLDRVLGLESDSAQCERARFSRARNLSLLYLVIIWAAATFAWDAGARVSVATPFVFAAICLDGASHLRFRSRYRDAVVVYRCHRVYWAVRIADALRAKGMAVHLAGLRHRSLVHVFGPYVPVNILVPAADAATAREILGELSERGFDPGRRRRQ